MAKSLLQITDNYLNQHEAWYAKFKRSSAFNDVTNKMIKESLYTNNLLGTESIIDEMNRESIEGTFDYKSFSNKYSFDLPTATQEYKENRLLNRFVSDDKEIKEWEYTYWNKELAEEVTDKLYMTERQYNDFLLDKEQEIIIDRNNARIFNEAKAARSGLEKFGSFLFDITLGVPTAVGIGLINALDNINGWFVTFSELAKGKSWSEARKISALPQNQAFGSLDVQANMFDWLKKYSNMFDYDNNPVSYGQYFANSATSIGEMLPSMLLGAGIGEVAGLVGKSAGKASKVVSSVISKSGAVLQTTLFYSAMEQGTFKELVNNPQLADISIEKKMANAAIKSGVELVIELALSKVLGASMQDKVTLGLKNGVKSSSAIPSKKSALLRILKDAGKEGLEEVLQSWSNLFVDQMFKTFDENWIITSEFNLNVAIDSFLLGALTSVAMSGIGIGKFAIKEKIEGSKEKANIRKSNEGETIKKGENAGKRLDYINTRFVQDVEGNIKDIRPFKSVLASWEYNNTLQELFKTYDDVVNNPLLSQSSKEKLYTQMVTSMATIGSFLGNIGEVRATAAIETLSKINERFNNIGKVEAETIVGYNESGEAITGTYTYDKLTKKERKKLNKQSLQARANYAVQAIQKFTSDRAARAIAGLSVDSVEKVTKNAKRLLDRLFNRKSDVKVDNIDVTTNEGAKQTANIINEFVEVVGADIEFTEVGNAEIVQSDSSAVNTLDELCESVSKGVYSIPIDELEYAENIEVIVKTVAQLGLVDKLSKNHKYLAALKEIVDFANNLYGRNLSSEEVVVRLFFDKEFVRNLVWGFTLEQDGNKYRSLLGSKAYEFLGYLNDLSKSEFSNKKLIPNEVRKVLKSTLQTLKEELRSFLIVQERVEPEMFSVFNEEETQEIRRQRIPTEFLKALDDNNVTINAKINGNKIEFEVAGKNSSFVNFGKIITTKLNSISDINEKTIFVRNLQNAINSNNSNAISSLVRQFLLNYNQQFNEKYYNKYDGTWYKANNNYENIVFNNFLVKNGIRLVDLTTTSGRLALSNDVSFVENAKQLGYTITGDTDNIAEILAATKAMFAFQNPNYTFDIRESAELTNLKPADIIVKYVGLESSAEQFRKMFKNIPDIDFNKVSSYEKGKSVLIPISDNILGNDGKYHRWYDVIDILDKNISLIDKAGLTVNELVNSIIYNDDLSKNKSPYLSDKAQKDIQNKYTYITPQTIFSYLCEQLLPNSILLTKDSVGNSKLLSIRDASIVLKSDFSNTFSKLRESKKEFKLSKLIKENFLTGNLGSIYVKFVEDGKGERGHYDDTVKNGKRYIQLSNSINGIKLSDAELRATLIHEFQHAIQLEYSLGTGFTLNVLSNYESYKINKNSLNELVNDFKFYCGKELYNNFKKSFNTNNDYELLNKFIYFVCSGELDAFNSLLIQYDSQLVFNFIPIVVSQVNGLSIVMPWGKTYRLKDSAADALGKYVIKSADHLTKITNSNIPSIYTYALIDDDGNFYYSKSSDLVEATTDIILDSGKVLSPEQLSTQSVFIVNDSTDKKIKSCTLMIPAGTKTSDARYGAIVDFIRSSLNNKSMVTITNAGTGLSIELAPNTEIDVNQSLEFVGLIDENKKPIVNNVAQELERRTEQRKQDRRNENSNRKKDSEERAANRTYISKELAADTALKYYVGKQVSDILIPLLKNVDLARVNNKFAELIKDGKLNEDTVSYFVRDTSNLSSSDPTSEYTFTLLNEYYFHNEYFDSVDEFNAVSITYATAFYALREVLRADGKLDLLKEFVSIETLKDLVNEYSENEQFKKILFKLSDSEKTSVDMGYVRLGFFKNYEKTIQSGARIFSREVTFAKAGYKRTERKVTKSLEAEVGHSRSGEYEGGRTIDEIIADPSTMDNLESDAAIEIIEEIADTLVQYRMFVVERKINEMIANGKQLSEKQKSNIRFNEQEKIKDKVDNMSKEALLKTYRDHVPQEFKSTKVTQYTAASSEAALKRSPVSVKSNITRYKNKIVGHLKNLRDGRNIKVFLKYYGDLFNDDLTLKDESYKGKLNKWNIERYINTEEKLKEISKEVLSGRFDHGEKGIKTYDSKQELKRKLKSEMDKRKAGRDAVNKLKRKNEQLTKKLQEAQANNTEAKVQTVSIVDKSYQIVSKEDLPSIIHALLSTEFSDRNETKVKYLTDGSQDHAEMSVKIFLKQNAETLASLTVDDAKQIIQYYSDSVFVGDSDSTIMYNAIKDWTLAYIKNIDNNSNILDSYTRNILDTLLKDYASYAGTGMAVHRQVLDMIRPVEEIVSAMISANDLEFSNETIKDLANAIESGKDEKIAEAIDKMYEEGVKLNSDKNKETKLRWFDKFWRFQRMCMLSSPGTWIRNIVSNEIVKYTNKLAEKIGKLIVGERRNIQGQYRLDSEVNKKTSDFAEAYESTFKIFERLSDGLNKWDYTKQRYDIENVNAKDLTSDEQADNRKTFQVILTDLVRQSVQTQVFMNNTWDSNTMQFLNKQLFKVLSDDRYIRKRAMIYFKQMLQEDIDNGKISIEGYDANKSANVNVYAIKTFAKAYGQAAYDYMHRTNFISKMEMLLSSHSKLGFLIYKQILPFASAGWNWFVEGLKLSPLGLGKSIVDLVKLESKINKALDKKAQGKYYGPDISLMKYNVVRDLGKGVIGTVSFVVGCLLGGFGVIRIDDEDDKMKLVVGSKVKIDISGIFGSSTLLAGAALFSWTKDQQSLIKVIQRVINTQLDESLFNDMFSLVSRNGGSIGQYITNTPFTILSSFVPNILKSVNKLFYNRKLKYSKGMLGQLERWGVSLVPGLAYALPTEYDPYTGQIQSKQAVPFLIEFINTLSPVDIDTYKVSENEKIALMLGVRKSSLTCNYSDIGQLNSKNTSITNQKYGELNDLELTKFYNNEKKYRVQDEDGKYKDLYFNQMTDKQRKTVTNRIMIDNGKYAKIYIWTTEIDGKYYADSNEYDSLKKLGITKNVYRKTNKQEGFVS